MKIILDGEYRELTRGCPRCKKDDIKALDADWFLEDGEQQWIGINFCPFCGLNLNKISK